MSKKFFLVRQRLLRRWWPQNKTVIVGLPLSLCVVLEAICFGVNSVWHTLLIAVSALFLTLTVSGYMMIFGPLPKRKEISYEQQKAKIAKWLYSHKKGGLSFRMKDIMRYSDENIRKKDRSLLKHTTRKPPVYVDADTAFKIISDLHRQELLTVGLSANKVEEFEVQFDGRDSEWQGIRVFNPNDLLLEPIRFIKEKIVWFLLTLVSSLISVYSRNILEWMGFA